MVRISSFVSLTLLSQYSKLNCEENKLELRLFDKQYHSCQLSRFQQDTHNILALSHIPPDELLKQRPMLEYFFLPTQQIINKLCMFR